MVNYLWTVNRIHHLSFRPVARTTLKNLCNPPVRSFSNALQRPRSILRITHSRSLWGSSSAPPSNASSISSTSNPMTSPRIQDSISSSNTTLTPTSASEPIWSDDPPDLATSPPDPSSLPALADTITSLPADIANVITPLQYGDLSSLGLISYTPAGLIRYSLEFIQVSTSLPWFWTIVSGTLFWRIVLLPTAIKTLRFTATVNQLNDKIKPIQAEMQQAAQSGSLVERQAAALKLAAIYKDAGVNPLTALASPLLQVPIGLGVFFGIQKMCELPVEQLKQSGFEMLPDLTAMTHVADPWYIMPALAVVLMNAHIKLSVRDIDPSKQSQLHIFNVLRLISPLFGIGMGQLPAGLMVSILTGISATYVQTALLQMNFVRRRFGIPLMDQEKAKMMKLPTLMESRKALYESLEEGRRQAERERNR